MGFFNSKTAEKREPTAKGTLVLNHGTFKNKEGKQVHFFEGKIVHDGSTIMLQVNPDPQKSKDRDGKFDGKEIMFASVAIFKNT